MSAETDLALLRRFEPIARYTRGEQFYPLYVEPYVRRSGLWVRHRNGDSVLLVPPGELTLELLGQQRANGFHSVQFLKLTDPLTVAELATYRLERLRERKEPSEVFHAGQGRLARVGYISRLGAAAFSLSLLARGRVPGDTAAAAALVYEAIRREHPEFRYHGRVVRQAGWVVLQYWFFYVFNDWRTGFFGANDHEADWEMISIYLAESPDGELAPQWVAYASHDYHGDDLRRRWDDPELEKIGEHPVIYVGAGSHASYFAPGEYLTELEVPYLNRVSRVVERVQTVWYERLRQYRANTDSDEQRRGVNLRIPFVDYARGDGLAIGPGQEAEWGEPVLIEPPPSWVSGYRGLWGYHARDPFAGEDAPAGPMYNRDGTQRRSWYDPVGWAGLDKVPTPRDLLPTIYGRISTIRVRQQEALAAIETKQRELQGIGVEIAAMEGQPHLRVAHEAASRRLASLSDEVARLRAQVAADEALLEALTNHAKDLESGMPTDPRAHIRRAARPVSEQQLRAARLAEIWAAVSIGILLIGVVALAYFERQYLFIGLVYAVALFVLIEAAFRGQIGRLITGLTVVLALVSTGVLIFEFFWQIALGLVVLVGLYILTVNLRELRR